MALRIGLIDDAGWFYPMVYAEALTQVPEAEIVAGTFLATDARMKLVNAAAGAADRQAFIDRFGLTPYCDIETMIRTESLDAVILFGEYSRKADHIDVAASCGVDIFTTKPPAVTMEQMQRIITAGETHNVSITVPEHTRFNTAIHEVHQRVTNGELGALVSARVLHQHGHLTPDIVPDGHWYGQSRNGGPEVSLGWYTAGLLRWFLTADPVRAFAEYDNYDTPTMPFMDNGKGLVRFADGTIGSMDIMFSADCPYPSTELELIGMDGNILLRIDADGTRYTVHRSDGIEEVHHAPQEPIFEEMRQWVAALLHNTPPHMSAREAAGILELCLAWKDSARTNTPVMLPFEPEPYSSAPGWLN
jgi:predicted dehydrogenase